MEQPLHITNNKREFRFEAHLPDGSLATLSYRWQKAKMLLMQTSAPPTGKNALEALIQYVLEHARHHHLQIVVYAPAVVEYMRVHVEYNELLHK